MSAAERSESVRMIRDSVRAIASPGDLARMRALRFDPIGLDRTIWRRAAELGWFALRLSEDRGGLDLGARELAAIAEELGAALAPEPIADAAAIAPLLDDHLRAGVLGGERIVLPAWQEGIDPMREGTKTRLSANRVTGAKILVPLAAAADGFLVTTADGLAYVDRTAEGASLECKPTQDGGQSGTLTLSSAVARPLDGAFGPVLHELGLCNAAYMLGAAERAFAITLGYLGVRRQFGRPIGAFQALQHRAVEVKVQLALSRAVLDEALDAVDNRLPATDQLRTGARALARVSDTAMLVAREAVQMHGAIGITDEHDIGLYCRKLLTIYNRFGTAHAQRRRYLAAAGVGSDL